MTASFWVEWRRREGWGTILVDTVMSWSAAADNTLAGNGGGGVLLASVMRMTMLT
jgi:hypothetical protein